MNVQAASSAQPMKPSYNAVADPVSLVHLVIGSKRPVPWETKMSYAERAGIKFVQLVHNDPCATNEGKPFNRSVSGFQRVIVHWGHSRTGGGRVLMARWETDEFTGGPIDGPGLNFAPNDMGEGVAYMPIGPFNLMILANAVLGGNMFCKIMDEEVDRQVRKLAEEIGNSPEHKAAEAEIERIREENRIREERRSVAGGAAAVSESDDLLAENRVLKEQIKKMALARENAALREKLAELVAGKVEKKADEQPAAETIAARKDAKAIREQAKKDVYAAHPELVDEVKAACVEKRSSTKGWAFTEEYQEKLAHLVEKRVKELELEHSDAGDNG